MFQFREENPLVDTTDPLEEGKRRLEEVRFDNLYKRPPTISR